MNKAQKVTTSIIACLFAVLGIVVLFWYFGDSYGNFYQIVSKEFEIAGLNEGFIPQGICYDEETDLFLTSGYMKDGSASRIYVVDAGTYATTKYFTLTQNGQDYVGHAGGIETNGENVWVVGDGLVLRFSFESLVSVENGQSVQIIDSFETNNGADFVTIDGDTLWIGEFQKDGKYDRDESHKIQTATGTNKAISFCYQIDTSKAYGVVSTTPISALSTTSLVQGMIITTDRIILSTSYSLANSNIYTYQNILSDTTQTFEYDGTNIPLYVLDDNDLLKTFETPCMSEEIAILDGRVYVLYESACQKYNFVTRESLRYVYSFEL